jgi:hypothetical protein
MESVSLVRSPDVRLGDKPANEDRSGGHDPPHFADRVRDRAWRQLVDGASAVLNAVVMDEVCVDAAPEGWREARLDQVIAEELAVNHEFAWWFAKAAVESATQLRPASGPSDVRLRFNVWHEVDDGNAGENDLDVVLVWPDGTTARVLIEDKVWAPLQPRQAERYRARANAVGGTAILVAPKSWIDSHPDAVAAFHGCRAIEEIIHWLRAADGDQPLRHRFRWRADFMEALIAPRARGPVLDHAPTIAFRDYCIAWLAEHCPSADASAMSLHTENQGWLWFNHPKDLGFKASTGFVDYYVAAGGFSGTKDELVERLTARPVPTGFEIATDTSNNIVLRHRIDQFRTSHGVPADTAALDVALGVCRAIIDWYENGGNDVLGRTSA